MAQINNKKRFAAVGAALAFLGAASFSVCLFVRNEDNKDNYIPSNNVMVYEPPKKLIALYSSVSSSSYQRPKMT